MSKTTKAGRRAAFQYHVATKWVIRGECEGTFLFGGAVAPIPQYAPRGWKARAWTRGGERLRVDIVANGAFLSIPSAPADETVTYELTPRR
jgi:hypothetical protein